MEFSIKTDTNALYAIAHGTQIQAQMSDSLQKLSSGLRINSAKDDASGLAIADSLSSQANALTQGIRNSNDAIGIIQIADKAMDEQVKVLDQIKTKATQAAQDGQTEATRKMISQDINALISSLDNIAFSTSYNGQNLLAGAFTNREFQIGAYSNQSVLLSIGATSSDKIGQSYIENFRIEKLDPIILNPQVGLDMPYTLVRPIFYGAGAGGEDIELASVVFSKSANTGLGALVEEINKNSEILGGIRASSAVKLTGNISIKGGNLPSGVLLNGVALGAVENIKDGDNDGRLVAAINQLRDKTGIYASTNEIGALVLSSEDLRPIAVEFENIWDFDLFEVFTSNGLVLNPDLARLGDNLRTISYGSLILTRAGSQEIEWDLKMEAHPQLGFTSFKDIAVWSVGGDINSINFKSTANLRDITGAWGDSIKHSTGASASLHINQINNISIGSSVGSQQGAMLVMDIAQNAIKQLDKIRSDLGSAQSQIQSIMDNSLITKVNVKGAQMQIREVDYAQESANFAALKILAMMGSYTQAQSAVSQKNMLNLLIS